MTKQRRVFDPEKHRRNKYKKLVSKKASDAAKRNYANNAALRKWRDALREEGYPKKIDGKMVIAPPKKTVAYRQVRRRFDALMRCKVFKEKDKLRDIVF